MKLLRINRILVFLLLNLFVSTINSQEGSPFLTDFLSDDESLNENYSLCLDKNGVLIIANRKGILTFDAEEWKLVKTPELPLIVSTDPNSDFVFVGCRNNVGYLSKNQMGEYEYSSLAGKEAGTVVQIEYLNSYVYFLSSSVITRINQHDFTEVKYWKSKGLSAFNSMFVLDDRLLVDVNGRGLQSFDKSNKTLQAVLEKFQLSGSINFVLPYDEDNVLIGASDNKCYLFDGSSIKNYQLQDQQYLSDGGINDGKILDKERIVISTAGAGCLVIEKKTGKTVFTMNYQTGLPDDEIRAMGTDRNQGIWLAHFKGLSRVDAGIPVKNFNTYKGLSGNLEALEIINGKLFAGTSNGIYFLDKKKDYVEYTVKVAQTTAQKTSAEESTSTASAKQSEEGVKPKETKKGFFGKLFSKKQKSPEEITASKEEKPKSSILNFLGIGGTREKDQQQKKVYRLASVTHIFTKVPGLEHKCKQLLNFNGKLIASTLLGVFEVNEIKAFPVFSSNDVNYIYLIPKENKIYICTSKGITIASLVNNKWQIAVFPLAIDEPVYSFAKDVFENYWIGAESKVYKVKLKADQTLKESKTFNFQSEFREPVRVRISDKKPIFFLSTGIYSIFNDSIQPNLYLSKYVGTNTKYYFTQQDYTWIRNANNWIGLLASAPPDTVAPYYLNLFDNVNQIYSDNSSNLWIINNSSDLYKIDQKGINNYKSEFSAFIKRFSGVSGEKFSLYGVDLDMNNQFLKINISAPYYVKRNSNQYQYFCKQLMKDWTDWSSSPGIDLFVGKPGKYELKVRARNIFGKISNEQTLHFRIKTPFYQSWWFYMLCLIAFLYLVYLVIKFRERNLQREKEILEQKVQERTKEIAEQKEHIEMQRDALSIQNIKITKQKEEIEIQSNKIVEQNREITDSIRYAKRLQTAVMPDHDIISALLSDYFVLFRPKDIVSGDFYWVNKIDDKIVLAAADCTGHGVPGGFLSMLGISLLNEISVAGKNFKANEFLNMLKARFKSTLIKEGHSDDETKDGMDIALCIIDRKKNKMQYAGANNSIYLIRNHELIEYDADKMPIGSYIGEKESFTNNEIDLIQNDEIFLFSDGYRDQMGGENAKRLKSPYFRKLLIDIHDKPMKKQRELLEKFFDDWKGNHEQVDDIMVLGVKIL
jgi:serine phosphatase RsbU (regulator of sigma subunit)/ligand-binding sensor domain-containing protein